METIQQTPEAPITLQQTLGDVPEGLSYFAVMGKDGDTKTMWDKTKPDEVEAARRQFEFLVKDKKYLAFKCVGKDGTKGDQVREFDEKAERYIFVPPMVGG